MKTNVMRTIAAVRRST